MAEQSEIPMACDTSALSEDEQGRYGEWIAQLRQSWEVQPVDDGYALGFAADPDQFVRLAEWARLVRLCCPFLDLDLSLGANPPAMELRLTGPTGARAFLAEELGLAPQG